MVDGRSNRKAKVISFTDRLELDRTKNFRALVSKARLMKMEGFDAGKWGDAIWQINGGRLLTLTGKNVKSTSFYFALSPKLGSDTGKGEWEVVAKAVFILRFHSRHQSAPNQRKFLTAIGYVAHAADKLGRQLVELTPEALNNACSLISQHYNESTAYSLHKHVAEFAAHCDANGLCRVLLHSKFSKIKRPSTMGGLNQKRLDDPEVLDTKSHKLIDPTVFKVIGELYLKVPKDHKYRFYVLMLTLFVCTGRRFSEISLLPKQALSLDEQGNAYIEYFPKKTSRGDVFTPKRRLYLPSDVVHIVAEMFDEIVELTAAARSTAEEMLRVNGPDLRFLQIVPDNKRLYRSDITEIGISETVLHIGGWLRKQNLAWPDENALTKRGFKPKSTIYFTNKDGIIKYCLRDFWETRVSVIHTDQFGKDYYLKDMLLIRPVGLSTGRYAHWLATSCTPAMFSRFL
ncbi:MAG: hypothetical protein ACTIKR_09635, partial [Advenella sp.]|uniref:hypothetical protein n=1 Tax=Advenella sp. TaxID=1872388 RepID=UPI003F966F25